MFIIAINGCVVVRGWFWWWRWWWGLQSREGCELFFVFCCCCCCLFVCFCYRHVGLYYYINISSWYNTKSWVGRRIINSMCVCRWTTPSHRSASSSDPPTPTSAICLFSWLIDHSNKIYSIYWLNHYITLLSILFVFTCWYYYMKYK